MVETLTEYVRRVRREKNLSTSDVEKASKNKISDAYVSQIENGYVKNVSPEKLAALADGLAVPLEEIINVAHGRSATPSRFEIYAERFNAADISESEWQYLELFFKDQVDRFRYEKEAWRQRVMAGDHDTEDDRDASIPDTPVSITSPRAEELAERKRLQQSLNGGIADEPRRKRKAG